LLPAAPAPGPGATADLRTGPAKRAAIPSSAASTTARPRLSRRTDLSHRRTDAGRCCSGYNWTPRICPSCASLGRMGCMGPGGPAGGVNQANRRRWPGCHDAQLPTASPEVDLEDAAALHATLLRAGISLRTAPRCTPLRTARTAPASRPGTAAGQAAEAWEAAAALAGSGRAALPQSLTLTRLKVVSRLSAGPGPPWRSEDKSAYSGTARDQGRSLYDDPDYIASSTHSAPPVGIIVTRCSRWLLYRCSICRLCCAKESWEGHRDRYCRPGPHSSFPPTRFACRRSRY
jgi:hypothetical protein